MGVVSAQTTFKINEQQFYYNLGKEVEILEDKSQKITLEQIRSGRYNQLFKKSQQAVPNFGYTHANYWFRISITQTSNKYVDWHFNFKNHFIDTLIIYQFVDNQLISTKQVGDLFPYNQRYLDYPSFLIPLKINPFQTQEIYIHFKGTFSKRLPIELVEVSSFFTQAQYHSLFIAIISGIFISLIIYNIFLYFGIGELSYLYYVLYLSCFLMTQWAYTGLATQLLFSDFPRFANIAFNFLVCPTLIFSNLFALRFLQIRQNYAWIYFLIQGFNLGLIITGLLFLYCIINPYYVLIINQLGVSFGLPSIFILYISSFFIFFQKRFLPAQYYIYAWGGVYIGFMLFLFKTLNWLPSNLITEYGFQLGSATEVLLLSFGLANRINQERKEKMRLIRENEKIILEQNIKLEEKVKKRTHEINEMNYELQQLNEELIQINETLHTQKVNLEELNREKDGLMSILAHDLRSPLGNIKGLMDLIRDTGNLTQEQQGFSQMIDELCNQSAHLINDILVLNSISQTSFRQSHTFDLEKFVKTHLKNSQAIAQKKSITFNFQNIDNQEIMITSTTNSLGRILDNLISNALKFSYPNTQIFIRIAKQGKFGLIEIQDEGQGIKAEEKDKLFKKFQKLSAQPTANENSTGLGLAIVKALVDDLKGNIEVQSEWGKGTTFRVLLPINFSD